jgi:hypothetical protein
MTIPVILEGLDKNGAHRSPHILKRNGENGLVVFNEDLRVYDTTFLPAFNIDFGVEMARDFSFGGTPVKAHNGTDTSLWTASAISGTKFTFDSTDQNNTAAGTKSVKSNKAAVSDVMEFDRLSDLDLSAYTAVTLFIYVDNGWSGSSADSMILYGWDTGAGSQVGNSIRLEDFFNEVVFGTWHKLSIPLSDLGLEASTIDAFRVEVAAKTGAGPVWYLDDLQVEQSGTTTNFSVEAPRSTIYLVDSISFTFIDALSTALTDNSMPSLTYNKILGLDELTNGIVFQRRRMGEILFSASIKSISDSVKGGGVLTNLFSDGTSTSITLETNFGTPIILDAREDDAIEILLSDDLSDLVSFTAIYKGKTRRV